MSGRLWRIPVLLLALFAAGCSLLPKSEPVTLHRYRLELPAAEPGTPRGAGPRLLLVSNALPAELATPRMLYQQRDHEVAYYARSRWVNEPARMLGDALVEILMATDAFGDVALPGAGVTPDLRVELELLDFQQDFRQRPSHFRVRLRVRLTDTRSGALLGVRLFEADVEAPSDDPYGGVQAASQATGEVLSEVAGFIRNAAEHWAAR